MKINENQKVTLTIGQLKRLVKESDGKFDPSTCKTKYFTGDWWSEDAYAMIGSIDDVYEDKYDISFTMHDDGEKPLLSVEAFGHGGNVGLHISLESLIALAKDAEIALNKLREMTIEHPPTSTSDENEDDY